MLKQFFDNFIRFRFVHDKVRDPNRKWETQKGSIFSYGALFLPPSCAKGRAKNSKQINKTSFLQRASQENCYAACVSNRERHRTREREREGKNYFIAAACCRQGSRLGKRLTRMLLSLAESLANKSTQQNVSKCAIYLIFSTRCWYGIDLSQSRHQLRLRLRMKRRSKVIFILCSCICLLSLCWCVCVLVFSLCRFDLTLFKRQNF